MFVSLGSMSLIIGPLCTDILSAWLSLAESRHKCTVPFGVGTITKVLHHLLIPLALMGLIAVGTATSLVPF